MRRGLESLELNENYLKEEVDTHLELLAEPIQMVLRRYGVYQPYEKVKELTRGKRVTEEELLSFVEEFEIPDEVKRRLIQLRPSGYVGLAEEIVDRYIK